MYRNVKRGGGHSEQILEKEWGKFKRTGRTKKTMGMLCDLNDSPDVLGKKRCTFIY